MYSQINKNIERYVSFNPDEIKIFNSLLEYKAIPKQKGLGENFDFDKAFAEGLTVEEARTLSKNKIREWWGK